MSENRARAIFTWLKKQYPKAYRDNRRIERAIKILVSGGVRKVGEACWMVKSQSDKGEYCVIPGLCECPDGSNIHFMCKHRMAVHASLQ